MSEKILGNNLALLNKSQEFKEILANEAFYALAILRKSVKSRLLTAPPSTPGVDDVYIPAATATGAWTGKEDKIAFPKNNAWSFYTPFEGLTVISASDNYNPIVFNGTNWVVNNNSNTNNNGGGRETLTSDREYFVRVNGSDSNSGATNNSAFATWQKGIDAIAALDPSIFNVLLHIGDGTYTQPVTLKPTIGSGSVTIEGNSSNPSNVLLSTSLKSAIAAPGVRNYHLKGFKLQTNTVTEGDFRFGLIAGGFSSISFENLIFGNCSQHIASDSSAIAATGNYSISGGAQTHLFALRGGSIYTEGKTVTLTGTPNFGFSFARAFEQGRLIVYGQTYSGSATGKKHDVSRQSLITGTLGNSNFFPGDTSGTVDTTTYGLYA